jgi:primosomal protein N' (replication factor Y) (superfamily II helicase)
MATYEQIAEVHLEIKALEIDHAFDYKIPSDLIGKLSIGDMVYIPFRKRREIGYVSRIKNKSKVHEENLKYIEKIISQIPVFDKQRLKLIYWMSFYYIQSVSKIIELFLPPGAKNKIETLTNPEDFFRYELFLFLNKENLEKFRDTKNLNRSPCKKRIIDFLIQDKDLLKNGIKKSELLKIAGVNKKSLNDLIANKIIEIVKKRVDSDNEHIVSCDKDKNSSGRNSNEIILNPYQKNCINSIKKFIDKNSYRCFLIEGLKENERIDLYGKLCEEVLNQQKQALILTPEISLAPRYYEKFNKEFRAKIGVYHSDMNERERFEKWFDIYKNTYNILIGTRSALFTPLNNLGIIIIDDEQDTSYKENTIVRYNAQDVAVKLGKIMKIPVVFCSSIPSITTKYKSQNQKDFMSIIMPERKESKISLIKEIIDLKTLDKYKEDLLITNKLYRAMNEELNNGNKVIIFMNKRGYSSFLICRNCGSIPKCPSCNLSYKFHKGSKKLICHHCGNELLFEDKCFNCGSSDISFQGTGIEKVEIKLSSRFKNIPIIRIDSDSTKQRESFAEIIKLIKTPGPAIIIGTQMITKIPDLEDVTLIGIINCDNMLELPDYHAYERVFQLFTDITNKVIANNKIVRVLIQTYNPNNIVISNFASCSYEDFYKNELLNRKELSYPPFSSLVNIIISGKNEIKVKEDVRKIYDELNKVKNDIFDILGPAPSPFYKINLFYRWHIMIKTKKPNILNIKLSKIMKSFKRNEENKIITDVDPAWIL